MNWFKNKKVLIQIGLVFGGIALSAIIFFINITITLPDPNEIVDIQVSQSTKIYARDGKTLLYEIYGEEKRTIIPPEEIPDFVRFATISIEDDSFYNHPAFDIRGLIRAFAVNIIRGRVAQGGSTITQQLAKNAFLSPERTITRKIRELVLAMRLERKYSKDEILDLYINLVPYGSNAYGIESAAQTYFAKNARDLTLAEISMLAALPNSPSYYSPWGSHTQQLEERRQLILKRMRDLGYIDDIEFQLAKEEAPYVQPQPETGILAPHFAIHIQDYLQEKYGEEALRIDGLKVVTTLDSDLQIIADEAVKTNVERNDDLYNGSNGALLAMDPQTGEVLAMVGSKDYFADPIPDGCAQGSGCRFEGNFNVALQGLRQPGSALKPFAYLTAFEEGLTPDTILWDTPTEFAPGCPSFVDFSVRNTSCYHPQNFDSIFRGPITMKEALAQSINVPAVKTLYFAGLKNVLKTLSDFGITTLNDPDRFGLSLVLGGGEIKLIELVNAYATLAADGVHRDPVMILSIEDSDGKVLEEYKEKDNTGKQVFDPQYVRQINDILSSVELRSPLYQSSLNLTIVPGHQVALKTGTTNDFVDAWTFGYTPNLAVGVWAGNNDRTPLQQRGSSILAAVPMWHAFTSKALEGRPADTFNRPAPTSSSNPILNGQLIEGEYRSILYHTNRVGDPQLGHWDASISNWLNFNDVDLNRFNIVDSGSNNNSENSVDSLIDIDVHSPESGSYIEDNVIVSFSAQSNKEIESVEIYLNDALADSSVGGIGNNIDYEITLDNGLFGLQNLIVISVTDVDGANFERSLILYK